MPISFDGPNSRHDVYTVSGDWQSALPLPPADHRDRATTTRLRPGTYYLIGNLLGLGAGLAFYLAQTAGVAGAAAGNAVLDYLVGSASATMMTLAMLIFVGSCHVYSLAWKAEPTPKERLTRLADGLSGFGALALGLGLFALGEPILALSSGLLHAWGKFGSALWHPRATAPGLPLSLSDFHRMIVVASRFPAIIAALLGLGASLLGTGAHWTEVAAPAVLLACYGLWLTADLQLFAADREH